MLEVGKFDVAQFGRIHSRRHYVELQQAIFGYLENFSGKAGEGFFVHLLLATCQQLEGFRNAASLNLIDGFLPFLHNIELMKVHNFRGS